LRPIPLVVEHLPAEGKVYPLELSRHEVNGFFTEEAPGEAEAVSDVTGEVKAYRSGKDVFVLGTLSARLSYPCVRCLERFEEDARADFHRVFSEVPEHGPGEVELRKEDLDLEPIREGTIDLARLAVEELLLALKAHPVCRESCLGLCPRCGGNLNEEQCRCEGPPPDPRFAVLEALKKPKKQSR
jgi:uncharacterized protein